MSKILAITAAGVVGLALGGTFVFSQFLGPDLGDCGATAVGSDIGGPFTLLDKDGNLVTDEDIVTEPTLIYFGFTFCPDFCPIDMARNALAVDLLAEQGISATPVFISIDPARDTPEIVGDYAYNFHEKAIGLTGSLEQVDAASKAYRTYYKRNDSEDSEFYMVDHTTFTYLTLPEIGFVEFFRSETPAEDVAATVKCFTEAV